MSYDGSLTDPDVSVIIPVKDDNVRLKECLKALDVQTYPKSSIEIIVVDNASVQEVGPVISCFEGVVCLREDTPGPAAARNKGISSARGEILAFTDADCVPEPEWIENGVKALSALETPGIAAGRVQFTYRVPGRPLPVEVYDTITYFLQKKYIEEYHFGVTANLFTLKEVVNDVGLFDSTFFKSASGEDSDWGRRVFNAGYGEVYTEKAVVRHPAVATFRGLWRKTARITRGNMALSKKTHEPAGAGSAEYFNFLYEAIWRNSEIKGGLLKMCLSMVAFTVIMVKIRVRLTG